MRASFHNLNIALEERNPVGMKTKALVIRSIAPLVESPLHTEALTDEALCGMTVEVLEQQGAWNYIRTPYRYEGWMHEGCLEKDPVCIRKWEKMEKKAVWFRCADILKEPRVQGAILQTVWRGGLLAPLGEPEEGWRKVLLPDGREGFTPDEFLGEYNTRQTPEDEEAFRDALVNTAMLYQGTQYRWGGKTPEGIDCSGLCSMAYLLNGVVIYRDASIKEGSPMHEISLSEIKKGDLLFFPGHVTMYIGGNRFIHSTGHMGTHGVTINSLDPKDPLYREDLRSHITAVGSIF